MEAAVPDTTRSRASLRRIDDPRWHLLLIVLVIVPLYAVNGRWGTQGNPDAIAVGLPAYQVVHHQTLDLSGYSAVRNHMEELDRWFVETPRGDILSNRAPGLIGLAIPSYAMLRQGGYSNGPATAVALMTTVLAVILSWHVLRKLVTLNTATIAALTLAIGTTTWWVSSSELWPHGPGQLWAAIALLGMSTGNLATSSAAFGLTVMTRPLTALFGTITGVLETIRTKTLGPLVKIGIGTTIGVAAVVIYNRLAFEEWTLSGGYSSDFTTGAAERFDLGRYLLNVWDMFVGLPNGVLVTTPIVGVGVVGSFLIRDRIPGWAKSAAWAGVVYLLAHAALNRASGGSVIFYRYPLEPLVLAIPTITIGALHLWRQNPILRRLVFAAIAVSIALQFLHVFVLSCTITDPVIPMCLLR
jgi:hypothetical protein